MKKYLYTILKISHIHAHLYYHALSMSYHINDKLTSKISKTKALQNLVFKWAHSVCFEKIQSASKSTKYEHW